jgi:hypothetical protein
LGKGVESLITAHSGEDRSVHEELVQGIVTEAEVHPVGSSDSDSRELADAAVPEEKAHEG